MTWHPPLSSTLLTVLVLVALGLMAMSFLWSRRELNPFSVVGMVSLGLRGAAFLLLLFFLLQPTRLPEPQKITSKRTLAILLDTSGSMSLTANGLNDGSESRLDLARRLLADHKVLASVTEQANLAIYGFDSQPTPVKADALPSLVADGKSTDLAAAIDQTAKFHQGDDLAGILILTDGRDTQGADPRAIVKKLKIPIYPMAVGEPPPAANKNPDKVFRDLAIESVTADPRIILGRSAQVVVSVSAKGYGARQVKVELLEHDAVVATSAVAVSDEQPRRQALFTVRPDVLGIHTYLVRIPLEADEANRTNNQTEFKVEVVDPVNRLVYLDRLRDERRFLKPLLAAQHNIRYTSVVQQDKSRVMVNGNDADMKKEAANLSPDQLRGIKAVILGDLPASAYTPGQLASLADWVDQGGALLVMGGPASLGANGLVTTPLAKLLPISLDPLPHYVEAEYRVDLTLEGAAHPAFQKIKKSWAHAAPLLSRFEVHSVRPNATVLMAAQAPGNPPVVVSQPYGHGKVAIVLTDSTWRWQLGFDPSRSGSGGGSGGGGGSDEPGGNSDHGVFWRQMIDWLMPDLTEKANGASQVQVIADRTQYQLNDPVVLLASVRGADGAPINSATVEFTISSPDGRAIQRAGKFEGGPGGGSFTARFEGVLTGQYDIQAIARSEGQTLGTDHIQVHVVEPLVEFANTLPDRTLLEELAKISEGQYLEPKSLDNLVEIAKLRPREVLVQPNADTDAVPAWDRWWLMAAFVGLMTVEWVIRRRNQWV